MGCFILVFRVLPANATSAHVKLYEEVWTPPSMSSIIKTTLSTNKRQEHSCKISTTKLLKIGLFVGPLICNVLNKICDHGGKVRVKS